ncbi:MAG: SMP-30/gluconolactonase/LRE family protein [Formivibrio sp.]|nr:SMP-30/gluconolactonase/LRE family protein [Formivibrio sp.]
MSEQFHNSVQRGRGWLALTVLLSLVFVSASPSFGQKKKKSDGPTTTSGAPVVGIDIRKVVWPQPPNIARVKYLSYFAGEKLPDFTVTKKKGGWMDRVAGVSEDKSPEASLRNHFFLGEPHGLAVDSKGKLYVADGKVAAIFIFDTETHDTKMIKNGKDASFKLIMGLAMDDNDTMFVADAGASHVLVFNPEHHVEAAISEGMKNPVGVAIDTENRFLYVADAEADQILVYDADSFALLRRIGTGGKNHTLTSPGDFAKPEGVAVDKDGNLYVADMLNARIEIFDADGNFIRTFGKRGDGPGYFAMPKGVAIDCDGHIWVTDSMQNRIQMYSPEGRLLMYIGSGQGLLPGMFSGVQGVTIDKQNRVFTSEVFPGRVQEFRYVTQAEATEELNRREAAKKDKAAGVKASDKPGASAENKDAKDSAAK